MIDGDPPGPLTVVLKESGATVRGTVTDAEDKPVQDGFVVLIPINPDRATSNLFRTTWADQQGKFSMQGVPPGDYRLLAAARDLGDGIFRSQEFLDQFEPRALKVRLEPGLSADVRLRVTAQ